MLSAVRPVVYWSVASVDVEQRRTTAVANNLIYLTNIKPFSIPREWHGQKVKNNPKRSSARPLHRPQAAGSARGARAPPRKSPRKLISWELSRGRINGTVIVARSSVVVSSRRDEVRRGSLSQSR